jgi:hypothetical protein
MLARLVTAGVLAGLLVGCGKKVAKVDPPADTPPPPPVTDKPGTADRDKGTEAEKPNWLNDPRFKQPDRPLPHTSAPNPSGKPEWGMAPAPAGGWTPPNAPQPQPPGAGQGRPDRPAAAGVPQPVPVPPNQPAAAPTTTTTTTPPKSRKTVTEADLKEIWVLVENYSGSKGKMPTKEEIALFVGAAGYNGNTFELIKDGAIVLTGATTRESVWAYEAKARTQGGLVVTQNGVETMTAAQLAQRLK